MSTAAELIGRALFDAEFRERLLADPEGTLRAEGIEPDEETLGHLAKLDPAMLEKAGAKLNRNFLKRGMPGGEDAG